LKFEIQDFLDSTQWESMDRFFSLTYPPGYVMSKRQLFDWQFGFCPGDKKSIICAWQSGEIIGMLGYIPVPIHWGELDAVVEDVWMANWMVAPGARNGVGAVLMRRLQEKFSVLLGQGANALNQPIAKRMGFRIFDSLPRNVAIFDAERMRNFALDLNDIPDVWEATGSNLHASVFTPSFDSFSPDWSRYSGMRFAAQRSQNYMEWRYSRHPVFQYQVIRTGPHDRPAVCVFRIEEVFGYPNLRVGRIVEFFHASDADGKLNGFAVISAALSTMRDQGCVFSDFFCGSKEYNETLVLAGMCCITDQRIVSRFCPVDTNQFRQNIELWNRPSMNSPSDLSECYFTKSDGDQDRPNNVESFSK